MKIMEGKVALVNGAAASITDLYMRFICWLILLSTVSSAGFSQENQQYDPTDQAALHMLPVNWQIYWNNHNMDSLGRLMKEDVDFVNLAGIWLKGRETTIRLLTHMHGFTFKNSLWSTDSVAVKYIKPDLAILHIGWGLSGDVNPDGSIREPKHGIFTWVSMKENGRWELIAIDNVSIIQASPPTR
jgi:uncharacterized protein (TIGR02246 family)